MVLSGKFSTSFLGFGQICLIHKDGGECFTACEVVSHNYVFCFLFEWVAWVWHVWFQHGCASKSRISFLEIDVLPCDRPRGQNLIFGNEVLVLSERGWAIVGVRVPGSLGRGLGNWLMEGVGFGWRELL